MTAMNIIEKLVEVVNNIFGKSKKEEKKWEKIEIDNDYDYGDNVTVIGKAVFESEIDDINISDSITEYCRGNDDGYYYVVEMFDENKYTTFEIGEEFPQYVKTSPSEEGGKFVLKDIKIFGKVKLIRNYVRRIQGIDIWVDTEDGGYWDHDDDIEEDVRYEGQKKNVVYLNYEWQKVDGRFFGMTEEEVKQANKPDDLLQVAVYATGLAAFQGHRDIGDIKTDVENWLKNYQTYGDVCCAWKDQTIGPVGLYVRGKVNLASNIDLWSWRDDAGVRHFDPKGQRAEEGIISRKEELDFTKHSHCEFFVVPKKIVGIWITKNFADRHPEFTEWAKDITTKNNIKFFIVPSYRS